MEFRLPAFPVPDLSHCDCPSGLLAGHRSMLVELDVNNPKQMLAPGMFAEVQWPVSRAEASLFVPRTAVIRTSERQFLVRVRNGVAEWMDVRRGELNGDVIEVFRDLREGDIVIPPWER